VVKIFCLKGKIFLLLIGLAAPSAPAAPVSRKAGGIANLKILGIQYGDVTPNNRPQPVNVKIPGVGNVTVAIDTAVITRLTQLDSAYASARAIFAGSLSP